MTPGAAHSQVLVEPSAATGQSSVPPGALASFPEASVPPGSRAHSFLHTWWPALAVATVLFLAPALVLLKLGADLNGGHLIYPLDDTYIHLAIAKHFVQDGTWGVSRLNGFSSSASSLLYPLMLAACGLLFGVNISLPLVLNFVAGIALIFYASAFLHRENRRGLLTFLILGAATLFSPLAVVSLTGMEHIWQTLICLAFLDLTARALADGEPPGSRERARFWLPIAACLLVMIRFEGLFFVAMAGLLLLCRRQVVLALLVGAGAALPVVVYGAISLSKGWAFLPNSVLLKGGLRFEPEVFLVAGAAIFTGFWRREWIAKTWRLHSPGYWFLRGTVAAVLFVSFCAVASDGSLAQEDVVEPGAGILMRAWGKVVGLYGPIERGITIEQPVGTAIVLMLLIAAAVQVARSGRLWTRPTIATLTMLGVASQHLEFASFGSLYRYETYLVFLSLLVVGIAASERGERDERGERTHARGDNTRRVPSARFACIALACVLCCAPFSLRFGEAVGIFPTATHNVYEQQIQMARFAARFYPGEGVAANDIGAIDYYADLRVADVWGLADRGVFQAKRAHRYGPDTLREMVGHYGVQSIMIYDGTWLQSSGGIPRDWILAGRWTISNNVICGRPTVSFYAPNETALPRLVGALLDFAPSLPGDVHQSGLYCEVARSD